MDKTEYKFPDELEKKPEKSQENDDFKVEIEAEGAETEVEVVDDTPKTKKKMEDPPKEADDEELSQYGEKVRRRIQHLQKGYHEIGRAHV